MWETKEVTLTLRLPIHAAEEVEAIQKAEPEVLERIVRYGLTRRLIYRGIRDRKRAEGDYYGMRILGPVDADGNLEPISEAEGRAILAENDSGGAIARWG